MKEKKNFTHQLTEEQNLKVVIRDVMQELQEETITENLNSQGYLALKITRMNGKNRNPAPLVLVEINRKFNSKFKLNKVCSLDVTVTC